MEIEWKRVPSRNGSYEPVKKNNQDDGVKLPLPRAEKSPRGARSLCPHI